jgi:flagellar hook-length control protein FliK
MNTASITAILSDIVGLPSMTAPSAPAAPSAPSFSDMLASASSSLAAFALLPAAGSDTLGHAAPPAPRKDPHNDNAAVPIALPAPVQTALAAAPDDSNANPGPSGTAGQPPAQSTPSSSAAQAGSSGTGGNSAQTAGGVALPPIAAELGTRIALGAQTLVSQPSQALASLPHGAPPTSPPGLVPNLGSAAHGVTPPDPTAMLPKLATSAALGAASSGATPPSLETALQSAAAQTSAASAASASNADAALIASTADTNAPPADPGLGAAPAPGALPLTLADATPALETAMPMVAASALDQVAASLSQGNKLGLSQIEIQLKPASLGAVDVKIELTHDGRVSAVISADRSDTLMQLQRGSGELQQALRDAGLQTDSGSLSFSLRGDPQTGDQSGRQPGYAPASSGSADDLLAAPAAIAATPSAHSGLLNIEV